MGYSRETVSPEQEGGGALLFCLALDPLSNFNTKQGHRYTLTSDAGLESGFGLRLESGFGLKSTFEGVRARTLKAKNSDSA